jgi:iron complex outermembrane receptor protein
MNLFRLKRSSLRLFRFGGGLLPAAPLILSLAAVIPRTLAQEAAPGAAEEPVKLSPFEVSSQNDSGYGVDQTMSATRTAAKLAELPISISIVTDQFLNDLAAVDIQSALIYENVTVPQTTAFTSNISSSYIIRGFPAATMHDGFLSAGGSTPVARIAIDRVEVVKGPESLLYGQMNPGGLVNIVSKRPSPRPSTTVSVSTGSYNGYGATFDSTGPITKNGRFSYRLMANINESGAITVGTAYQRKELVAMLDGKLTANTNLNLEFDFAHHHTDAPGGEAYFVALGTDPAGRGSQVKYLVWGQNGVYGPSYNYRGPGTYGDGLERFFTAVLQQRLGTNWNFRLAFASLWDTSASLYNKTGAPVTTANSNIAYTYNSGSSQTQSVQLDVTSTYNIGGAELKFLAGTAGNTGVNSAIAGNSTFSYTGWTFLNPSTWPVPWPPLTPPLSTFTATSSNSGSVSHDGAIYTSDSLALFQKRLHLLAGARAQRVTATATNYIPPRTVGGFGENDITYQGGALFQLFKNLGVYANWSQSFLPQSKVLRTPKPVDPITALPLPGATNGAYAASPIKGEGHDLGFKWALIGGKLAFTASYYDTRLSNIIQTRTNTNPANGQVVDIYDVQAGAEWSQGVEFGLVGSPCKGLDIMLNYNQPFTGLLLSDTTSPTYVGKELQNNPKEQFTFFTKYTVQQSGLKGVYIGLGGRYWGDSQAFAPTQPQLATIPPYFIMDGVAGYRWKMGKGQYSLQLNLANLLDRHVLFSGYTYSGSTTYNLALGAKF